MKDNLVRLQIEGISMDNTEELPVVLLRDMENLRMLPVPVGPFEANAIIMLLKGIRLPRMLTHELFAYFMAENKFTVSKLLIYEKTEDSYKSTLFYKRGRRSRLIEVRPSDGIALTMQFGSPIFAPGNLLRPKEVSAARRDDGDDGLFFIENDKSNLRLM